MFLMVLEVSLSQSRNSASKHEVGLIAVDAMSQHCNLGEGDGVGAFEDRLNKHTHKHTRAHRCIYTWTHMCIRAHTHR